MKHHNSNVVKIVAAVTLMIAYSVLVVEVMQETGMLQLKPHVEYHRVDYVTGHQEAEN